MGAQESGFYYLKSRYYDPKICRFINADDASLIGADSAPNGLNLFAYCKNNPVNRADGMGFFSFAVAAAIVGGLVAGATQVFTNVASGKQWSDGLAGAIVGGATYNFVTVATGGNTAAAAYSAAFAESFTNEFVDYAFGGKELNSENIKGSLEKVAIDTAVNGTLYFSTGKQAEAIVHVNYKSWFKPSKIASCFTGNFAKKMTLQTMSQALLTVAEKKMINCAKAGVF